MKRKTRKQIEKEYDELYQKVSQLVTTTNPCEVSVNNGFVNCMACHKTVCCDTIKPNELCCDGCPKHSMTKGCQADKPLYCKLWLCWHAKRKHPEVHAKLNELHDEALKKFGCLLFRGDKKETIDHILNMNMNAIYTA